MEAAMTFIENTVDEHTHFNHDLILELHKMTVQDLSSSREGDLTPGQYRKGDVSINNSSHTPPLFGDVRDYMEDMFTFLNADTEPKYDLLKMGFNTPSLLLDSSPSAMETVERLRLLTYATLIKQGFKVRDSRLINPSAVFCSDRNDYYENMKLKALPTQVKKRIYFNGANTYWED